MFQYEKDETLSIIHIDLMCVCVCVCVCVFMGVHRCEFVHKHDRSVRVYQIFRPFPFVFFFMQSCSGYIKMVIYYNTDRCHLTLCLRVLTCCVALLSIIIHAPRFII